MTHAMRVRLAQGMQQLECNPALHAAQHSSTAENRAHSSAVGTGGSLFWMFTACVSHRLALIMCNKVAPMHLTDTRPHVHTPHFACLRRLHAPLLTERQMHLRPPFPPKLPGALCPALH
jgi:hypothetical protein